MERTLGVFYARLSQQAEKEESMVRQEVDCRAELKRQGVMPVAFVEAPGHRSGRSERNRPAWLQLVAYLKSNHRRVKCVVVQDSDRVSRDVITRLTFFKQLETWGIEYVSLLEPHLKQDMPTAERNLMNGMTAVVAQHYADFLSEKQRNRVRSVKERGGKLGDAPRGLKAVGKGAERKFVKGDEKALSVIVAMMEEYVSRQVGMYDLTATLAARGLTLPDRYGVWRPVCSDHWESLVRALDHYDGIVDAGLLRRERQRLAERSHHNWNGGN